MKQPSHAFWSVTAAEILKKLQTTAQGLSKEEAQERLARYGSNLLKPKKKTDALTLLLSQFKSPIILILLFDVGLSFLLHDSADGLIILIIVLVSSLLGFWQERGAVNAVEKLLAIEQIRTQVKSLFDEKDAPEKAEDLARILTEGRWTHDYPITYEEAVNLGLHVTKGIPPELYQLMSLYPQPVRHQPSVEYIPIPRFKGPAPKP